MSESEIELSLFKRAAINSKEGSEESPRNNTNPDEKERIVNLNKMKEK